MNKPVKPFSVAARIKSVGFALAGIRHMLVEEHNSRVHLVASVAVLIAALLFQVSPLEWCALIFAIALVWSAEAMNTAIEALADLLHPEQHPSIKVVKDTAAAAVLFIALGAATVGMIIFVPYLCTALNI